MLPLIQQLETTTSKSIQASLIFPTLTSIVLELVHLSLNAQPGSFIEVYISLAPEWQITFQHDAADAVLSPQNLRQGSSLDYLSYLGVVDVQSGQCKHIQKAGNVVFSGLLSEAIGVYDRATTSITLRNIFRNLPVRRQAFSSSTFARSELERCRRALSVVTLPYYSIRITLRWTSIEHAGSKIILDAAKTTSLLTRYESLFSLPGPALPISAEERVKESRVRIAGFLVTSLLSSRSHQHMLSNGRLQDDTDYSSISAAGDLQHANWIRAVVLEVLGASYIGANQSHNRSRDAKSYTAPGRYFGYFLDIRISEPDQIDQMHLGAVIKSALCDVLQAHHLLPVPDTITAASRSRRLQLKSESPTKKVRGCDSVMVDKACKHSAIASGRRFTLDRTGLLREPTQARSQDTQAEWLTDVLLSWKSVLPSNLPVEERFLALTDKQCDAASGYFDEERGQVLQKAGLATSRVTGQVDAKYISIVYGEDTLILVDQHAAHERVRLEALLSRYWTDCSERHSARLHNVRETSRLVDLSSHLARVFEEDDTIQSLDYWGFIIAHGSVQEGNTTVEVEAIPEILEGKLGSEQALRLFVIDLAASLEDKSVRQRMKLPVTSLFQSNKANGWIAALRHLPTPLLDLFNSMACRGAIMFNDPLTHQQCEELIDQLSRCTFPFQCAHGRPSMTPLTSLHFNDKTTLNPPTPSRINWAAISSSTTV